MVRSPLYFKLLIGHFIVITEQVFKVEFQLVFLLWKRVFVEVVKNIDIVLVSSRLAVKFKV